MTIKERLSELLPRWLGKPFHIGRIDCIQLIWALYPHLPRGQNGVTAQNYVELWREDKQRVLDELEEYLMEKFEIVANAEKQIGDVIVTADPILHGVWLGGNKMLCILEEKGALPIPLFTEDYITLRPLEAN